MSARLQVSCGRCGISEFVDVFDYYSDHFDLDMEAIDTVCDECVKRSATPVQSGDQQ